MLLIESLRLGTLAPWLARVQQPPPARPFRVRTHTFGRHTYFSFPPGAGAPGIGARLALVQRSRILARGRVSGQGIVRLPRRAPGVYRLRVLAPDGSAYGESRRFWVRAGTAQPGIVAAWV